mgnify:CR=1 FL=1
MRAGSVSALLTLRFLWTARGPARSFAPFTANILRARLRTVQSEALLVL